MNNEQEKIKSCQRLKSCYLTFMILILVQLVYVVASFFVNTEGFTAAEQELATNIFYAITTVLEIMKIAVLIWFAVEYYFVRKVTKGLFVSFNFSVLALVFALASFLLSLLGGVVYITHILTFLSILCYFTAFEFHINTIIDIDRAMRYKINFVMGMIFLSIFCKLLLLMNMSSVAQLIIYSLIFVSFAIANAAEFVILKQAKVILESKTTKEEK